jgi:hypothetical protein
MIDNTDKILLHKFYQAAGKGALRILLDRIDSPPDVKSGGGDEVEVSTMSAAERKKEKARLKKLAKKEAEPPAAVSIATDDKDKKPAAKKAVISKDEDPDGAKILEKDPLEEASRWSLNLTRQGCTDPSTHALVCDVMVRRAKYVLSMRSLSRGLALDPFHPELTLQLLKFAQRFYRMGGGEGFQMLPVVEEVVREQLESLLGGQGSDAILQYLENFVNRASAGLLTLSHRIAAAQAILLFSPPGDEGLSRARALLLDGALWVQRGIKVRTVLRAYEVKR